MTLAEFVAARLDERQKHAEATLVIWNPDGDRSRVRLSTAVGRDLMAAEAMLRIIEAQRRTLARHAGCGEHYGYCGDGGHGYEYDDGGGQGCADLADLAAPDHAHPDFNPAWTIEETS